MLLRYLLVFTNVVFIQFMSISCEHSISKRYLMFPRRTVMQFSTGLTVPLVLPRRSINFSFVAQVNYNTPSNISTLQPKIIKARDGEKPFSIFDLNRYTFYRYIIGILDSFGLDGEQCLYRSICEIAEFPMYMNEEETLLEKLVHFMFTPSLEFAHQSLQNETINKIENEFTEALLLAEQHGLQNGDCSMKFEECIVSIVDLFTKKYLF